MMPIVTAMCTSYKQELLVATHNHTVGGDVFNLALFLDAAVLNAATTVYSVTSESSGTGYVAGGSALTNVTPTIIGTTAVTDFADLTFPNSTITARGCQIYNSTDANRSASTHDFGSDQSSSNGDFTLQFPTADATNAILRLA